MDVEAAWPGAVVLPLGGHALHLLPQRAVWWPAHRTLLVADLHLGKGAHFRARGLPVPTGTTADTLERLSTLLRSLPVRELVVLGDFVHAADAFAPPRLVALTAWRRAHADVTVTLVPGNHDRHLRSWPASLALTVQAAPYRLQPGSSLLAAHHPRPVAGGVVLAGHLHPAVQLQGQGRDRLRLPCFALQGGDLLVLPAFGAFTGAARALPPGALAFVVTPERVVPMHHRQTFRD